MDASPSHIDIITALRQSGYLMEQQVVGQTVYFQDRFFSQRRLSDSCLQAIPRCDRCHKFKKPFLREWSDNDFGNQYGEVHWVGIFQLRTGPGTYRTFHPCGESLV